MSIIVYGASDDLIEIEGDIREEFTYTDDDDGNGDLLAFSDGTVLRITYTTAGIWRIALVVEGACTTDWQHCPEDDEDSYSDRVILHGAVRWVVQGIAYAGVKA